MVVCRASDKCRGRGSLCSEISHLGARTRVKWFFTLGSFSPGWACLGPCGWPDAKLKLDPIDFFPMRIQLMAGIKHMGIQPVFQPPPPPPQKQNISCAFMSFFNNPQPPWYQAKFPASLWLQAWFFFDKHRSSFYWPLEGCWKSGRDITGALETKALDSNPSSPSPGVGLQQVTSLPPASVSSPAFENNATFFLNSTTFFVSL